MASNIALLYGGTTNEAPAVEFTSWLVKGLNLNAECLFARDSLAALTPAQRQNYRALLELGGWNEARDFLIQSVDARIGDLYRAAQVTFESISTSRTIDWSTPLELTAESEDEFAELAYCHDFVLASFALLPGVMNAVVRNVMVNSGTPLVTVAHAPRAATLKDATIIVAWKAVAPTRRAIHYALPLLKQAAKVHLVAIEGSTNPATTPSAMTVADYLQRHHDMSTVVTVMHESDTPETQLADFYRSHHADLLVMGAYSHSRLQTLLFGSFVKRFLAEKDCNLLMVH